jgi:hypothetical protein
LLIDGVRRRPLETRLLTKRLAWLVAGGVLPLVITVGALAAAGVLDRFRFWAIDYVVTYASQVPPSAAIQLFRHRAWAIVTSAPLLWSLAGVGLVAASMGRGERTRRLFIGLLVVFSLLAISPGFYFRPHYFVLALPAAALLTGLAAAALTDRLEDVRSPAVRVGIPVALLVIVFGVSIAGQREYLFTANPVEISRRIYFPNPFVESVAVAERIGERSAPGDRIAVLGSEPQIYFYANRRSATGYVYAYPLMEEQPFALEMQEEMIREIEAARPRFVVYVGIEPSWRQRAASPTRVFEWFQRYQAEHYKIVGLVEILPEGPRYHWEPDTRWPPSTPHWISVLESVESHHSR